jgi:hypothetical protein
MFLKTSYNKPACASGLKPLGLHNSPSLALLIPTQNLRQALFNHHSAQTTRYRQTGSRHCERAANCRRQIAGRSTPAQRLPCPAHSRQNARDTYTTG